ncbi:MAG: amino acid ABC transporter ATP-binding protein [Pigmentiphaga sp.]|nr:amino acid ABC transporter ATP-binding protein [Pigmentiphaga sp.]
MVEIRRLSKHYGDTPVLNDVSLTVKPGEVVSLIGPSGSGKTTLLRCINFLERYDGGDLRVLGHTVGYRDGDERRRLRPDREIAAARADTGMVFQSYNLFPHLTVLENIVLAPMRVRGIRRREAVEIARALLARVNLADKEERYPAALSGGQQQRVAIARALAMRPRLLLMDEVTSALDPQLVGEVLDVMRALAAEGMTMILATHEMEFARQVSSQVVFMADGAVVESGPPAALFEQPRTERLQRFLQRYRSLHAPQG